jgi:hypothetical protein
VASPAASNLLRWYLQTSHAGLKAVVNMPPTDNNNNSNSSTGITNEIPRPSIESTGNTSSHKREFDKKMTTSDTGPRRGNRAAPQPKHLSTPDVQTYIEHLAARGRRSNLATGSPPHVSRDKVLETNGRGSTFRPQYAPRNHGDMVWTAFQPPRTTNKSDGSSSDIRVDHGAKITRGVWSELSRQRSVQVKKSSPAVKSPNQRRDSAVAEHEVLHCAIQDRGIPE